MAFSDLDEAKWAKEEITMLAKLGLINGRGDNTFKPNDPVTRAEFLKMTLSCLMIAEERGNTDFLDVVESDWYYPTVATALRYGIVSGIDDDFFAPNKKITREEMAVMLYRAMQNRSIEFEEVKDNFSFEDKGEISEFASASVEYLYRVGIINGYSEAEFAPKNTATRAQAAKMLALLVKER